MTLQEYLHELRKIPQRAAMDSRPAVDPEGYARRCEELEHSLTVDFRLGREFPQERRRQLLDVHRRMARSRTALTAELQADHISAEDFARRVQALAESMIREYERLLTPREFRAFLDLDAGMPAPALLDAASVAH